MTGEPGTAANVVDTSGSPNHILDFYIPKGEKGDPGKDGTMSGTTMCGCVAQMRNVLAQLITKYSNKTVTINLETGGNDSGILKSIYPNATTGGLLVLVNASGALKGAVSICHIASVTIPGESYDNTITYMPTPSPLPAGCDTDCEEAIRAALPVGTTKVNVKAGGKSLGNGTVLKNVYGMLVLIQEANTNPSFVSTCKVEVIDEFIPTPVV